MDSIGKLGKSLGLDEPSQHSFCRLLEYVTGKNYPSAVIAARYSSDLRAKFPPAQKGHLFDMPLAGEKQITYLEDGQIVKKTLKPGEVFYTPPLCWKFPTWEFPHEMCAFIFNQDYIRLTYINIPRPETDYYLPPVRHFYHTVFPPDKAINSVLHSLQLINESGDPTAASPELVSGLLRILWACLNKEDARCLSKSQLTYQRVLQYMREHYYAPINREHVANEFKIHPSYLSRLFKRHCRESFHAVLTSIRMEHAAFLLKNTDLLIDEIADRCGYLCPGLFYAAFKKHYGNPPGTFRRINFREKES